MNILALDLGTKCGWAVKIRNTDIFSGVEKYKPRRGEQHGYRWLYFKRWLSETISRNDITCIYIEHVRRHLGTDAAHMYGAYKALVELAAFNHTCTVHYVGVGTIKKFATGKGNALKKDMIAACIKAGHDVKDDNQADAYWICRLAMDKEGVK